MIKANYHTHLFYCHHADGNASDYILEAIKNKKPLIIDSETLIADTVGESNNKNTDMQKRTYSKLLYHNSALQQWYTFIFGLSRGFI